MNVRTTDMLSLHHVYGVEYKESSTQFLKLVLVDSSSTYATIYAQNENPDRHRNID
jgi:hypothetical protein